MMFKPMCEIERKFVVRGDYPKTNPNRITQGYILDKPWTMRVRLTSEAAYMTFKGKTVGISRTEIEFRIPRLVAKLILGCIRKKIDKTRYTTIYEGKTWEIDEFHGDNKGLIVAEVELKFETEPFYIPRFCTNEVSTNQRYFNSNLIKNPYKNW